MSKKSIYLDNSNNKESVWYYFLKEENGNTAKCKEVMCQKILKVCGGSTSGLHTHLKSKHAIDLLKRKSTEAELKKELQSTSKKNKVMTEFFVKKERTLAETVARLTAKDGLPFRVFTTSEDLRRALRSDGYSDLPKSASTIKKMVMDFAKKIQEQQKNTICERKLCSKKFSVTFDEWTSIRNRRFINIILHGHSTEIWNLGLIRMHDSMPAEKCLELVKKKLADYNLCINADVVCIITDGTSVMTKIGKLCATSGPYQQLCFAHGVQLAVLDVLYKKKTLNVSKDGFDETDLLSEDEGSLESPNESENESYSDSETDEQSCHEEVSLDFAENLKPIIDKVRRIVKLFRRSPLKNEILQKYVKADTGKELTLLLDSKTRWNSLVTMLERFHLIRNSIKKALVDVNQELTVEEWEFIRISDVVESLKPVQATVEALCRRDGNLITADAALRFTLKKLRKQNTGLSIELTEALVTRISQRRSDLSGVLMYLHTGKYSISRPDSDEDSEDEDVELFSIPNRKVIVAQVKDIINRMSSISEFNEDNRLTEETNEESHETRKNKPKKNKTAVHEELDKVIVKALSSNHVEKPQSEKSLPATIRQEMKLFEDGGKRGYHLSMVYDYLLGIVPTSVESERAFSASGYLCNKIRCRLDDETLSNLCFLRSYFQNLG